MDDRKAAELFRMYAKRLYNTALRITLSPDESDEIMQKTLLRYLEHPGKEPGNVWAWLRTACVHLSVDWLRRRKRFVNIDETIEGTYQDADDSSDVDWGRLDGKVFPMVMNLLSGMPDGYRTILILRLIEEYDYPEIASMLGISEAGVRSQYMRGRRKLAMMLSEKLKSNEYE